MSPERNGVLITKYISLLINNSVFLIFKIIGKIIAQIMHIIALIKIMKCRLN